MRILSLVARGFGLALVAGAITSIGIAAPACEPSSKTLCGTFGEFSVDDAAPHGIVYNPSGALQGLWYTNATNSGTSAVVQFIPASGKTKGYRTPTSGANPGSINFAPDASLWFTETDADKVATIDASKKIAEYRVPTANSKPLDITRGPDGAMWFTESGAGKIGRIARDGSITEYAVGSKAAQPASVITGPDKALWFTEVGTGRIGRLTTAGRVRHFDAGPGRLSGVITVATDDALWFNKGSTVTRMTTTGALTEFALPNGVFATGAIFGSSRGGVYLGAIERNGTGAIFSVNPSGALHEYDLPEKHLLPIEMAQTASGSFWMTVKSYTRGISSSKIFVLK